MKFMNYLKGRQERKVRGVALYEKGKKKIKKKINYTKMSLKNSTEHFGFMGENWRPS